MPTGYTSDVKDGKITSFREFAALCARAMGANIMMRDDPFDAPIKNYQPSTFYKERLEEAQEELRKLEAMSIDQVRALQIKKNRETAARLKESTETKRAEQARYEAMLAKVRAWTPPTAEHEGFKKFMLDQLVESIKFDCYDPSEYYEQDTRSPEEYLEAEVKDAHEEIGRCAKEWAQELERVRGRNDWNRRLFESLKGCR